MSCECGGSCTTKFAALENMIKVLEGRIFSLESRLASKEGPRDPFMPYPWTPVHVPPVKMGCPVCGIGANGEVMGYVCVNPDCPTRVTSVTQ